jgi:hypothetical protein
MVVLYYVKISAMVWNTIYSLVYHTFCSLVYAHEWNIQSGMFVIL